MVESPFRHSVAEPEAKNKDGAHHEAHEDHEV
jgi:hypothetical protein